MSIPYLEYSYLSKSAFLVNLTAPNKQFSKAKSETLRFDINHINHLYVYYCSMSICFKQVISLASKSGFVTKFACDNLAAKRFAVKLLNSEVVIYLS